MNTKVRIGIVGCGAVTEVCHLPAARLSDDVEIAALVDLNVERARSLAEQFGIPYCTDDYAKIFDRVDGAIVATPHYLHSPVAMQFLKRGVPVLIEKPLALTADEARAVLATAQAAQTPLQAGYMYRFCEGARVVKHAIEQGWLGRLKSFSLECGGVYSWPAASGFYWNKERAGGGVLIDTGSHMLDMLLWWLGDVLDVDYRDDYNGGVEAECEMSLVAGSEFSPVAGNVTLSRLRGLADRARIVGEQLTIEYDVSSSHSVRIFPDQETPFALAPASPQRWIDVYTQQLDAFGETIASRRSRDVSGESVLPAIELIDRCYATRKPLVYAWDDAARDAAVA